ncbi:MAG: ATP-binding protein [Clostridia bacterium]|nr:ATP-binding protein [Clostridia bacterium]
MGFNRENYARIKQEYEGKYLRAQEEAQFRRAEVHDRIPEIRDIDRELSLTGLEIFRATVSCDEAALALVNQKNRDLLARRAELLEKNGFPKSYTEIKYECAECGDTGVVGSHMCACMKKKLVRAGIESSGMGDLIERQRFDNFSLNYYKGNETEYRRMSSIYSILKQYAENFDAEKAQSIALLGGTGLGKTHLSSALAGVIIENGNDVYYTGAMNMFADFEQKRFGSNSGFDASGDVSKYFTCDLLIIDDVGTEMSNQFSVSCLYNVINTRLNRKKPTIISTNLTQDEFRKRYWDRISSRVFGEFLVLPFAGTDIRQQKLQKV